MLTHATERPHEQSDHGAQAQRAHVGLRGAASSIVHADRARHEVARGQQVVWRRLQSAQTVFAPANACRARGALPRARDFYQRALDFTELRAQRARLPRPRWPGRRVRLTSASARPNAEAKIHNDVDLEPREVRLRGRRHDGTTTLRAFQLTDGAAAWSPSTADEVLDVLAGNDGVRCVAVKIASGVIGVDPASGSVRYHFDNIGYRLEIVLRGAVIYACAGCGSPAERVVAF